MGSRVKAVRGLRGLTREALAVNSSLSWSAVTQVETGRRTNVRPNTLSALAAALDVTVDYLVHGGASQTGLLDHHVLLYGSDEEFRSTAGAFVMGGLDLGQPVLAVLAPGSVELLRDELGTASKAVEFADATDWYASPTAALGAYERFLTAQRETGAAWVRIIAELALADSSAAEIRRWMTYESLVNLTFASAPMTFLCAYDQRSLPPKALRQALQTHTHTVDQSGTTVSAEYADPCTFVLER
jgi:transcriptional regulator with XRE-family HTH domain